MSVCVEIISLYRNKEVCLICPSTASELVNHQKRRLLKKNRLKGSKTYNYSFSQYQITSGLSKTSSYLLVFPHLFPPYLSCPAHWICRRKDETSGKHKEANNPNTSWCVFVVSSYQFTKCAPSHMSRLSLLRLLSHERALLIKSDWRGCVKELDRACFCTRELTSAYGSN